jgi:hypothetical protein
MMHPEVCTGASAAKDEVAPAKRSVDTLRPRAVAKYGALSSR